MAPHLGNLAKESLASVQVNESDRANMCKLNSIESKFQLVPRSLYNLLSNIYFFTAGWACALKSSVKHVKHHETSETSGRRSFRVSSSQYARDARSRVRILRRLQHHEWCESGQASWVKWQPISHTLKHPKDSPKDT